MNEFPHVKRNWENTFEWLIKNKWTKSQQLNDKELAFKWWISENLLNNFMQKKFYNKK